MDIDLFEKSINKQMPGTIENVENRSVFDAPLVELKIEKMESVARYLRSDPNFLFDWLETVTLFEEGENFVFSYFVRSFQLRTHLVLRGKVRRKTPEVRVSVPSVGRVWPMGAPMELDISKRYDVVFG